MAARPLPPADYLRQCFVYDPESGVLTWKARPREHFKSDQSWNAWNARFSGKAAGRFLKGRFDVCINYTRYFSARIIFKLTSGRDPVSEIDHINNDPSDDRWDNLREATHLQNQKNQLGRKGGMKGAYLHHTGRWSAEIRNDGVKHWLGLFDTAEEAHDAYVRAALKFHGEFANLKNRG